MVACSDTTCPALRKRRETGGVYRSTFHRSTVEYSAYNCKPPSLSLCAQCAQSALRTCALPNIEHRPSPCTAQIQRCTSQERIRWLRRNVVSDRRVAHCPALVLAHPKLSNPLQPAGVVCLFQRQVACTVIAVTVHLLRAATLLHAEVQEPDHRLDALLALLQSHPSQRCNVNHLRCYVAQCQLASHFTHGF